jgi:hypothetical protein
MAGWSGWAAIAKDFIITRSQRQVGDYASKWKEYERVINPPLASISMSASSESDDKKPGSKSPEEGGSATQTHTPP